MRVVDSFAYIAMSSSTVFLGEYKSSSRTALRFYVDILSLLFSCEIEFESLMKSIEPSAVHGARTVRFIHENTKVIES